MFLRFVTLGQWFSHSTEQFCDKIYCGHELSPFIASALVGISSLVETHDLFKRAPKVSKSLTSAQNLLVQNDDRWLELLGFLAAA
jgi:hypothetical protein